MTAEALSLPLPASPDLRRTHDHVEHARPTEDVCSPSWPRTSAASWALHLLLAIAALAPVWPSDGSGGQVQAFAVALIVSAVARLGLESMGPSLRSGLRLRVAAAIGGSAVATGVLALSSVLPGIELSAAMMPASGALSAALLLLALNLRKLEFVYGARSRRVVLIGPAAQRTELIREAARTGGIDLVDHHSPDVLDDTPAEELAEHIRAVRPTLLVLSEDAIRDQRLVAVAAKLNLSGVRVRPLRDLYETTFGKVAVDDLSPAWFLFDIAEIHRARLYGRAKRAAEVVIGLLGLLAAAPLMLVVALAVKLASPGGPVLFRQERVGRHGRVFELVKFRTMHPDPALETETWASANQRRIFALGSVLRKLRVDELPQLWNVVGGNLSLVGPRPEQPAITQRLAEQMPYYTARHAVRPGLTGWAQVNYGYGGSDDAARTKLQYDLYYVKRQSLRLDMRILVATIRTVALGAGR